MSKFSLLAMRSEVKESKTISFFRDFAVYLGPALIVSVSYMDPDNYGTLHSQPKYKAFIKETKQMMLS